MGRIATGRYQAGIFCHSSFPCSVIALTIFISPARPPSAWRETLGSRPNEGSAERRCPGAAFFGYFLCRSQESNSPAGVNPRQSKHLRRLAHKTLPSPLPLSRTRARGFNVGSQAGERCAAFPGSSRRVTRRIADPGGLETGAAQSAGIALSTGPAFVIGLIAGHGQAVVHAQLHTTLDDLRLAQ